MLGFAITLVTASCGDDGGSEPRTYAAQTYTAVIRAVAPERPGAGVEELDHVVYAGPINDRVGISLDTQAAVVEDLEQFATIRFVDDREEALRDDETESVKDDGVLVLLGPVSPGLSPTVRVRRYVDVDDRERFRVTVSGSEDEDVWNVVDIEERTGP